MLGGACGTTRAAPQKGKICITATVLDGETPRSAPQPNRIVWKRAALYAAIAVPAIAALLSSYHWFTVGRFIESTDDAYVGGDITVIAPKVSGFVQQVVVTDNQAVKAGDLLVKIDDREYRAVVSKADAA